MPGPAGCRCPRCSTRPRTRVGAEQFSYQRQHNLDLKENIKDSKTKLQEFLQARRMPLPEYEVTHITGEAHKQQFIVQCSVESQSETFEGVGSSRRMAEQEAAQAALKALGE